MYGMSRDNFGTTVVGRPAPKIWECKKTGELKTREWTTRHQVAIYCNNESIWFTQV